MERFFCPNQQASVNYNCYGQRANVQTAFVGRVLQRVNYGNRVYYPGTMSTHNGAVGCTVNTRI